MDFKLLTVAVYVHATGSFFSIDRTEAVHKLGWVPTPQLVPKVNFVFISSRLFKLKSYLFSHSFAPFHISSMPTETPIVKTNGVVADKVVGEENPNLSAAIEAVKQSLPPGTSIHPDAAIAGYDREKLKDAAWRLTLALETPGDTVQRVAYYASVLILFHLQDLQLYR